MSKQSILITGAQGQLGKEFGVLVNEFPEFNFFFVSKDQLSITDRAAVEHYFNNNQISICINCAAYTAVDKAETEPEVAYHVNAEGTAILAGICKKHNASFVHISTDYVFAGNGTTPYKESDDTHPINVYAASKLKGEELAFENNAESIIFRTSWVYSSFGKNFVKTMAKLMKEKDTLSVVADQLGSPTYAADLASAIMSVISKGQLQPGIYHYSNSGVISWFDFAEAILELTGSTCLLKPITTEEYPTPAMRPHYSALNTTKFKETFQIDISNWKESLAKCIVLLQNW